MYALKRSALGGESFFVTTFIGHAAVADLGGRGRPAAR